MIKAIIFDCFGVLTIDLWKEFVTKLPQAQRQLASSINHSYDRGEIDTAEFMRRIETLTGRSPGDVEDVRNSDGTKNEELLRYIRPLKHNYKIGLISNVASNWIREKLLDKDELSLFDDMVLSFEVGITKPDPRIFRLACERLGVKPEEAILVDDIERYCTAAKELGMKTITYKDFQQCKKELEALLST